MKKQIVRLSLPLMLAASFASVAEPAFAYIGPGAGLTLLGALWGLIVAVGASLLFVLMWPFRRHFRRRKPANARPRTSEQGASSRSAD